MAVTLKSGNEGGRLDAEESEPALFAAKRERGGRPAGIRFRCSAHPEPARQVGRPAAAHLFEQDSSALHVSKVAWLCRIVVRYRLLDNLESRRWNDRLTYPACPIAKARCRLSSIISRPVQLRTPAPSSYPHTRWRAPLPHNRASALCRGFVSPVAGSAAAHSAGARPCPCPRR